MHTSQIKIQYVIYSIVILKIDICPKPQALNVSVVMPGMEEAMGVENSGVLYALWNFVAQAPDELSFKEGDMVTILQKPEGSDWWWASLCGREGFVPNNFFGVK